MRIRIPSGGQGHPVAATLAGDDSHDDEPPTVLATVLVTVDVSRRLQSRYRGRCLQRVEQRIFGGGCRGRSHPRGCAGEEIGGVLDRSADVSVEYHTKSSNTFHSRRRILPSKRVPSLDCGECYYGEQHDDQRGNQQLDAAHSSTPD